MNGIINVYKEQGYTSFDVVAKLRGILKQKKIGHTGTLDPDACGVLPVCLGKATKVCELLTDKDKVYEAVLLLGRTTDTQDTTGQTQSTHEVTCTNEQVTDAVSHFIGDYDQIPPMYSALKVNGKKLCDLARAGIEVERKSRRVHIFSIDILDMELPRVKMRVHCSKGTYIRTLCQDIGEMLGCGGCMESLLRTRVADFDLEHAYRLSEIEEAVRNQTIAQMIAPIDQVFLHYPALTVKAGYEKLLYNGNRMPEESILEQDVLAALKDAMASKDAKAQEDAQTQKCARAAKDAWVRIYDAAGAFIGIYEYRKPQQELKPVKIFME
ncbi:MAG: tRNA pseudouridine(55) synthase TruB [Lachnospiraceae bacterium]|nr:tRNA pseudouridine(55) synthase TruB [Lachnospiraceae bacterium]